MASTKAAPAATPSAATPPPMFMADGAGQPYRAAVQANDDKDGQVVLVKTVSVAMDGKRDVRFLVQNHGTVELPAGTLCVSAAGAYTQGMASLRPLAPGLMDVVTVSVNPTSRFGFSDAPAVMEVTVRRNGLPAEVHSFKELVSEYANEMRMQHLKCPHVRVALLGASDSGKSSLRNTAHTALARKGRSGVSSVAAVGGNSKAGAGVAGSEKQSHTVVIEYTLVDRVVLMDGPGSIVTHQWPASATGGTRPALTTLIMEGSAVPGMTTEDLQRLCIQDKERAKLRSVECGGPSRVPQAVIFCIRADEVMSGNPAAHDRARAAYDVVRDHRALVAVTFADLAGIESAELAAHGAGRVSELAKQAATVLGVDAQLVHVLINYTAETEPQHGMDVAVLRLLRASVARADEWEQQRLRKDDAKVDTIDDLLGEDDE